MISSLDFIAPKSLFFFDISSLNFSIKLIKDESDKLISLYAITLVSKFSLFLFSFIIKFLNNEIKSSNINSIEDKLFS